jgi:hypothetical protein
VTSTGKGHIPRTTILPSASLYPNQPAVLLGWIYLERGKNRSSRKETARLKEDPKMRTLEGFEVLLPIVSQTLNIEQCLPA